MPSTKAQAETRQAIAVALTLESDQFQTPDFQEFIRLGDARIG